MLHALHHIEIECALSSVVDADFFVEDPVPKPISPPECFHHPLDLRDPCGFDLRRHVPSPSRPEINMTL
jgi:hypothetical protein